MDNIINADIVYTWVDSSLDPVKNDYEKLGLDTKSSRVKNCNYDF